MDPRAAKHTSFDLICAMRAEGNNSVYARGINSDACTFVCAAQQLVGYISQSRLALSEQTKRLLKKEKKRETNSVKNVKVTKGCDAAFEVKCMCINVCWFWYTDATGLIRIMTCLSTVCCWQKAVAKCFCNAIVFILTLSSAKNRKDQVWIWDTFENFFQITVVGQNLLIFFIGFKINSHDLLSSTHVDAVSVSCNHREKDAHFSVECFFLCLMLWAAENREQTTNTAGGEVCVWTGEKRSDQSRLYCKIHGKHESDLIFFLLFCPSLTCISIILTCGCYSHYFHFQIAHSPIFCNPFIRTLDFSRPSKNPIHILLLVSLFFHLHLQPLLHLRYFSVDRRPFETEYPFTSHTFLINENDFFSPTHTHTLQGSLILWVIVNMEV